MNLDGRRQTSNTYIKAELIRAVIIFVWLIGKLKYSML